MDKNLKLKQNTFCFCLDVSAFVKILTVIHLAIWMIFVIEVVFESNELMQIVTSIVCLYNFVLCGCVIKSINQSSNILMKNHLHSVVVTTIDVILSIAVLFLAISSSPYWEYGGKEAYDRVYIMAVQVLIATLCYAVSISCYYWMHKSAFLSVTSYVSREMLV